MNTGRSVEVVGVGVALAAAIGSAIFSFLALSASKEAAASAARTEVTGYATRVVQLDREADERNGAQITVLIEQASAVLDEYGEERLNLAASTYRVLATYAGLDTENRALAKELGEIAVSEAKAQDNTIEEIRAHRILADVAAQDGNVSEMERQVDLALSLANNGDRSSAVKGSVRFTGAFAVYSALWADLNGGHDAGACGVAERYFEAYGPTIQQLANEQSLETSRRAYRLRGALVDKSKICGLSPKQLRLQDFKEVWLANPDRVR